MKNIRVYCPEKYNGNEYRKIKKNIYETTEKEKESSLSLRGVADEELKKILRDMDDWKECEGELEEDLLYVIYDGKKYYKEIDDERGIIYVKEDSSEKIIYVTSIQFEQEPEFGENEPGNPMISQYPLEDILDKFRCHCYDGYKEENKKDLTNSYIEFASEDMKNIENLLDIVGKHVYNKEDGEYVDLIIE